MEKLPKLEESKEQKRNRIEMLIAHWACTRNDAQRQLEYAEIQVRKLYAERETLEE